MTASSWKWGVGAVGVAIAAGVAVLWLLNPAPIVRGEVEVPSLRGSGVDQAVSELAALGLRGRLAGELADPLTPAGTVSWQSPAPGTALPESSIVRLGVSTGAPRVIVPEVVDLEVPAAARILAAAGLAVGRIDSVYNPADPGVIIGSRPDARQPTRAGTSVELIVSRGPRNPR